MPLACLSRFLAGAAAAATLLASPQATAQGTTIVLHEVLTDFAGFANNSYEGVNLTDGVTTLTFTLGFTNAPISLIPASANGLPGTATFTLSDGVHTYLTVNSTSVGQSIASDAQQNISLSGQTESAPLYSWAFNLPGGTSQYPTFGSLPNASNFAGSFAVDNGSFSLIPANPSRVRLLNPVLINGQLQVSFWPITGHTNTVRSRTNLASGAWQPLTNVVGDGSLKTVQVPATNPACFIQVLTQ